MKPFYEMERKWEKIKKEIATQYDYDIFISIWTCNDNKLNLTVLG